MHVAYTMKFWAQSELTRATVMSRIKADLSKPQIKDVVRTNGSRVEAFVQDDQHAYSTNSRSRARAQMLASVPCVQ